MYTMLDIIRMAWTVHVLSHNVVAELEALPADMRARFARIVELIEDHGLEKLREPLVKLLDKELGRFGSLVGMEYHGDLCDSVEHARHRRASLH
jgi:hypothetical protein